MGITIEDEYFDWLCYKVCNDDRFRRTSYLKLLLALHNKEFIWYIPNDENRAEEGVTLRSRFAADNGYGQNKIFMYLSGPCTVLEMMVALALRCEENIMVNPQIGDRTTQWFWDMIKSLGLMRMSGRSFDLDFVEYALDNFLHRQYKPNGEGGLFTIRRCREDLRDVEIWYQLCWYLDYINGY